MKATIGDRVAVQQTDSKEAREAVVIDIRDSDSGQPTYLVEWQDNGHRQLVAFGTGSAIQNLSQSAS